MKNLLAHQLSEAVGRISNILMEDVAVKLGYEINSFPAHEFRALVHNLGNKIYDKDKAEKFLSYMASFQDMGT